MKQLLSGLILLLVYCSSFSQDTLKPVAVDSMVSPTPDTTLRIINLYPHFNIHVDSSLSYQFQINKNPENYFWYLKNAPAGIRIHKDNGILSFRADKSYFLSGRLKYDVDYRVLIGVQNLNDPGDKTDSSFTITFFNTDIIPSRLKPTVSGTIWTDEGEPILFRVLCETGNFPIENILTLTSIPIGEFVPVRKCNDEFSWVPAYSFVKDSDTGKARSVTLSFIGTTKFNLHDTVQVKLIVRDALNYPLAREQYNLLVHEFSTYILQLKYTFLVLDQSIKKTKKARTTFDLTAAGSALTGTVLSTSKDEDSKRMGTILPSVGVAITPIKEATAPTKTTEQNQAALLRSSIKRLEYVLNDNQLVGEKDPQLQQKMNKLKEELKQSQMQLIDVPLEISLNMTEKELNKYFNSPKVNKKYRLGNR